jgi:SAM-dependent methyltransferase
VSDSSTDLAVAQRIQFQSRRAVLGREIADVKASGFLSPGEIDATARRLRPFRIRSLLDLGCGNGALGLRLAARLGCERYIGVDRRAQGKAWSNARPIEQVRFVQARFDDFAGAVADPVDGAVSHDALYLAGDPGAALDEIARVLQAGRPLLFTAYVGDGVFEGGIGGRSLESWLAAVRTAGFRVEEVQDLTSEWRGWGRRFHQERLKRCGFAESNPRVRELARISRHFLGIGGRSLLDAAQRRRKT